MLQLSDIISDFRGNLKRVILHSWRSLSLRKIPCKSLIYRGFIFIVEYIVAFKSCPDLNFYSFNLNPFFSNQPARITTSNAKRKDVIKPITFVIKNSGAFIPIISTIG